MLCKEGYAVTNDDNSMGTSLTRRKRFAGTARHWLLRVRCFCGHVCGWIDIRVGDLLFTALLVLAPCMMLGLMRPHRAWRWAVVVGICVPVVELLGYLVLTQKPYRAQIYESFLAFLPGIAGSYGGAMLKQAVGNILGDK